MDQLPTNRRDPPFNQGFTMVSYDNLELGKYYYISVRSIFGGVDYGIVKLSDANRRFNGQITGYFYEQYYDYNPRHRQWEELNPPAPSPSIVYREFMAEPGRPAPTVGPVTTFYIPTQGGKRRKTRRGRKHRRRTSRK